MSGKRSIFEEVGETTDYRRTAETGAIDRGRTGARGWIRAWLAVLFLLVVAMIALGGATRLTDSGLSITEWRPVTGALPPMSETDWQAEFDRYRAIDQFELLHSWMELDDFKRIYWWEWSHRQLGRVIGLVWALGFAGFLLARKIPPGWTVRLLIPGVLGGLQGAVGWWMVSSGVTQGQGMTAVASYRLAVHLGLAFAILGLLAWYILLLGRSERDLMQARRSREDKLFRMGTGLMHFAFLQILIGALVAGIDAGRTFTDWPLMAGGFFPPDPFELSPVWRNFFENPGLVQLIHRLAGYLLLIFGIVVWLRARKSPNPATRGAFSFAFAVLIGQVVLGIVTVLMIAPLELALAHQLTAVALFSLIIRARFNAAYPRPMSVRGARA